MENQIVDIRVVVGGEEIEMENGAVWFHPFDGGNPTKIRDSRAPRRRGPEDLQREGLIP